MSRTPNVAEMVSPLPQSPSKPASSTIFAESPSWASMRKAISDRVISRRSAVVFSSMCPFPTPDHVPEGIIGALGEDSEGGPLPPPMRSITR